ncbi:MAG: endolytic transglycosylase MltG, partial [Tepidiformaceae bacterium]
MNTLGISKLAILGTFVVVAAILGASYVIARTPSQVLGGTIVSSASPPTSNVQIAYTLAKGRSASDVGNDLEKLGVIRSSRQFELLVSLMGVQDKLSAGDYQLQKDSSTANVVNELTVKESVPTIKVTFPEGIRIEEMASLAAKAGFGTNQQFLDAVKQAQLPPEIAAMVPAEDPTGGYRLQGFLFPDTYILPAGASAKNLVDLMLKTFVLRFTPDLQAAAQAHGLTPYQAITLASIVEREAVLESERPLIAGVFYNRLAAGDLLGADPTVQFAVALDPASVEKYGYWKKELTVDDLANKSPYNTRLFAGMPPGPITNPGLASIKAVANPAVTDDYYFVADAKKADGSHL